MQSNVIAPWAEPVPGASYPFHVADLATLPDGAWRYEIVEGRLFRMPSSGLESSWVAANLLIALGAYVKAHKLGIVTGADGTYDLTRPGDPVETALVPDVAFVQSGRHPIMNTPTAAKYGRFAPDLAVEVGSPSQSRRELAEKARLFLERGVRLVWVIWPDKQEVEVWRPMSPQSPVTTLGATDSLDGLDVVPGFTLPVVDLFSL